MEMVSRRILNSLGLLSLIGLPFLAFWPVAAGQRIWAVGDFAAYHHPLLTISAQGWRKGHLPLWNPYIFGGTPLLAAQQAGVLYPLNILMELALPPWQVLGLSILAHLALTGLGVWLYLRSLGLHPAAAWMGSIVFAWGGFTMSHLGHIGILRALPWIGFSLHGFHRWIDSARFRHLMEISFSVAFLCLSGYVQIVLYSLLLIATYFVFAFRAPLAWKIPVWLAAGLGIGLSAPQWLPGVELWVAREYLRPGEGNFSAMTGYSFHPAYLATLLFPRGRAGTFAEMVGYVGVIPLIMILLSVFMDLEGRLGHLRRFFVWWLVVSLLLAMGRYFPPLAVMVFLTPVFGSLGVPSKHLLEFSFSAAVLSAIALDAWIRGAAIRWPSWREIRIGALVALAGVGWAWVAPYAPDIPPLRLPLASWKIVGQPLFLFVGSAGLLLAWRRVKNPVARRFLLGLLAGITIWDLLDFGLPIYRPALTVPEFYETPPATIRWLQERDLLAVPYRILSLEATGHMLERGLGKTLLAANYNAAYGVESVIGHDGLMPRRLFVASGGKIPPWGYVTSDAIEDPGFRALLDQMSVGYLLVRSGRGERLLKHYRRVAEVDGVEIYRNETARPRLFGVVPAENAGVAGGSARVVFADPQGRLWVDPPVAKPYRIRLLEYSGDRVVAQTSFAGEGLLIHSANWVRGWRAWVDGKPVPVIPVNGFLQGIPVPPGEHGVVLEYAPVSFWLGAGIACLSLMMLIALCGFPGLILWKANRMIQYRCSMGGPCPTGEGSSASSHHLRRDLSCDRLLSGTACRYSRSSGSIRPRAL